VDGNTPKPERAAIFQRFRTGDTTVLCACAVIDEGLDVPEATVLQITRPTASLRLWRQLIGRVLRPAPGKAEALIIDHTDNWRRLPPPDAAMEWKLNAEVQEPREARQLVISDTGEVVEGEAPPVEVETDGRKLVEITPAMLAKAHPITARKLLNEQCRQDLAAGSPGLRHWLECIAVLDDSLVVELGRALAMPAGWAQGQLLVRNLLSPGQRLAATKRLQTSWGARV
jgi:type I site-specific restriction endonuclease